MSSRRPRIFLSDATADRAIAAYVEEHLRAIIANADVYRTSRTGQLTAGVGWFAEIESNLRRATTFIVLVTPCRATTAGGFISRPEPH